MPRRTGDFVWLIALVAVSWVCGCLGGVMLAGAGGSAEECREACREAGRRCPECKGSVEACVEACGGGDD